MKSLPLVTTLTFIFFLLSCGPKGSRKGEETALQDGKQTIHLKNINTDFTFPESYQRKDIYALIDIMKDTQNQDMGSRMFAEASIKMIQQSPKMEVVLNNDNSLEHIFFNPEKYFKPSKLSSGFGLGIIKSKLESMVVPFGGSVELLDNKLIRSKTTQILKGKFKIRFFGFERYWTQYLVTVFDRTFTVLVSNDTGDDFEGVLKKMKVYE